MAAVRRLAAILAADVAGYSRLMEADEEGTLERLKGHRRALIDPKIDEYRGRIVKTTGDGILADFPSAVDAVRCAAEVQRGMLDREVDLPEHHTIRFRIGINLGDIILDSGDIFGDGVNIAARLETLADPGGICLSGTVYDQLRNKLTYRLEDRGEQSVRNIARPVHVYALTPDTIATLPAPKIVPLAQAMPSRPGRVRLILAAAAAMLLAVTAGLWWHWPGVPTAPASAPPTTSLVQGGAPHLSIVALPFANLTNDPEHQYLADGITEDVTTDLSRLPGMLVISRNSAFTYKNKQIDTRQIGRELNVRYVLEGSVQRASRRIRVNAQLIDAETDKHLWAERFDRDAEELFELQNDITSRIALALQLEIVKAEARRPTSSPDVLDYLLRARAIRNSGPPTRERYAEAIALIERAVDLDPGSIGARVDLGLIFIGRVLDGGMSIAPKEDITRAETLLASLLIAEPQNPSVRYLRAQIARAYAQGDFGLSADDRVARFAAAIPDYEFVLVANPNDTPVMSHLAWCKFMTGSSQDAIPLLEKSIRLNPRDPNLYLRQWRLATIYLFQGRIAEAIELSEQALTANPSFFPAQGVLAAGYGLAGDPRAATEVAIFTERLRKIFNIQFPTVKLIRKNSGWNSPPLHEAFERYYITGLRKAGMPEQ
jgi:adenylate cyclase